MLDHEKEASLEDAGSPVQGFQKEGADDDTDKFVQALDEADTEAAILQDQYQLISMTGTTNREQAEAYKDRLPAGFAMESFTTFPTRTNVMVALEALSTGVKIALMAGVVAVLGAAVFFLVRAGGRKMDKVDARRAESLDKVFTMSIKRLDQGLAADLARENKQYEEQMRKFAERGKQIDLLYDFANLLKKGGGATELVRGMVSGDYNPLHAKVGSAMYNDARMLDTYSRDVINRAIHDAIRQGSGGTVESILGKAMVDPKGRKTEVHTVKTLMDWAASAGIGGETVSDVERKFRAKYLADVDVSVLATAGDHGKHQRVPFGMWESSAKEALRAQVVLQGLARDMEDTGKRLESAQKLNEVIPRDVVSAIRDICDQTKEHCHAYDLIFMILAAEARALNQITSAQGKAISEVFREVVSLAEESNHPASAEIKASAVKAHNAMKNGDTSGFEKELKTMTTELAKTEPKEGDYLPHGDLPDDVKEAMRKFRSKDNDGPIII